MTNREKIIITSIDVFIEYGFNGATISRIVKESGLSNGAFYHHFKNMSELLNEVYVYLKNSLATYLKENINFEGTSKNCIKDYWFGYVEWGMQNKNLMTFYQNFQDSKNIEESVSEEVNKNFTFLHDIYQRAIDDGYIEITDILAVLYITHGTIAGLIRYLQNYPEKYTEEFVMEYFKMYWKSIVSF